MTNLLPLELHTSYNQSCDRANVIRHKIMVCSKLGSRPQWPHGPRHETSSSAQALGSWFRIPFEAWVSVRVYLCLCCPV